MVKILRKFTISEFNEILRSKCYGGLRFRKFNEILWLEYFVSLLSVSLTKYYGRNVTEVYNSVSLMKYYGQNASEVYNSVSLTKY